MEVIVVDHDADPVQGVRCAAHPRITYERSGQSRVCRSASIARPVSPARRSSSFSTRMSNFERRSSEPLAACLGAHQGAAIVGGLVREADGGVQASARRFPDLSTAFGGRTSWLTRVLPGNPLTRRNLASTNVQAGCAEVDWVTGAFMMVRHDVFETLGGFDEHFFMYWEDSDLCLRALKAGWKTMYEPGAQVVHFTGRASRHAPVRSLIAFHRSVFRHYWKHGSWVARLAALWLPRDCSVGLA